ncbi:MAG: ATP synthase subunit I [Acidobacteriota bacterium]|nr:ATP synthase subunit I [Acidobacteriota bacterium]
MSDNSEPVETEQQTVASLSQGRFPPEMIAVTICGGLLGFVFVSWQFGTGVLFGGGLSLVNYYWLKNSLRAVFEKAAAGDKPRFPAGAYFLRYAAFGAVLLIIFLTKSLPITAVLLGLASFAFAIIVEASILLFSSVFKK